MRRSNRGSNSATLATAAPLGDTQVPAPPAPPPADAPRNQTLPLAEPPDVESPPPLADTPAEPIDTLMDMPAGITTLPDLTPIGKPHKSGAHKSAGLTGAPLPGVKAKRRKRKQTPPWVVMLGLVGVIAAAGIVALVLRQPADAPGGKESQKVAEQPEPEEKPVELVADRAAEPPAKREDDASSDDAMFEDDEHADAPKTSVSTKGPAAPRGRSNSAGLFEAIEADGTAAAVQKLIAAGADVGAKNKDGRTVLRLAVIKGRADLVKALLAAKANPNAADALGETPLMSAAKAGNAPIVKLLLEAGANPNVQTSAPLAPIKSADTGR